MSIRRIALMGAVTLAMGLANAAPDPPRADYVKIAYWNCEHFVDDIDDPYVDGTNEDTGGRSKKDLALFAKAMIKLDADVLVMGETEGEAWVRRFNTEYLADLKYDTVTATRDENWHQNMVLLSRIPVGAITTFKSKKLPVVGFEGQSQSFLNNRLMFIELMPRPDYTIYFVPLHLKAGTKPEDKGTRMGQIDGVKAQINRELRLDPNLNVLVMGDMNFTPTSDEYKRFFDGAPNLTDLQAQYKNPPTHPAEYPTRHIDMTFANGNILPEVVPGSVAVARPLPVAEQTATSDHLPIVVSVFPKDRK